LPGEYEEQIQLLQSHLSEFDRKDLKIRIKFKKEIRINSKQKPELIENKRIT